MDPSKQTPSATPLKKPSRIPSGIPAPAATGTSGIPTASNLKRSTTSEIKSSPTASNESKSQKPSGSLHQSNSGTKLNKLLTASTQSIDSISGASSSNTQQASVTAKEKSSGIKPPSQLSKNTLNEKRAELAKNSLAKSQQTTITNNKSDKNDELVDKSLAADSNESATNDTKCNDKDIEMFKIKIKDLEEKLETLRLKRAEDREKLREYDKIKLQIQQFQEFKVKAQQEISDLNKELAQAKHDAKTYREQYDTYRDEMSHSEHRIEEMTVDKELAEAKVEEQQEEISKLNDRIEELQLELEVLKGEIEVNGVGGAASSFQLKQAEKEQERLKSALIKLRDCNLQDKSEINNLRKQNEEYSNKIKALAKEIETLKSENQSLEMQVSDLKDQVTATLGSVQMIEQLTERNLDLESNLAQLRETIGDLEAINEVNDQLQENAREEERELRQALDLAEARIRESEKQMESLKYTIADHEKTILKFRELVKQLQNENEKLNRQYQSKLESEKLNLNAQQATTNYDFKTKLIETKNYAKVVENELFKIEITSLKKYVTYLLSFMNENFTKRGGDHESILTLLLFKRLISKSDFLLKELKEKYPMPEKLNKDETKGQLGDQAIFLNKISMYLTYLQLLSSKFDLSLNNCSQTTMNNIACMCLDLNLHEKSIDYFIDLLQKNQLDETSNCDSLEKSCLQLSNIYKNHINDDKYDHYVLIDDFIKFGSFSTDLVGIGVQRLQLISQAKENDLSEILMLLKEVYNSNGELKSMFKKLNRLIPRNERKQLNLNKDLIDSSDKCLKHLYKLSKVILDMCDGISTLIIFSNEATNDNSIPSKKLEDLAYQACDKNFSNDDSGPYENISSKKPNITVTKQLLRNSINEITDTLNRLITALESNEYERDIPEDELKINAPITLAADAFKNILIEAETLKYKLDAKDDEIKDLKKHLKFKTDELSENKVRLSLMEKKFETTQKENEEKQTKLQQTLDELKQTAAKTEKDQLDTIEALQQEIDTLQNDKRELKEKVRQFTKKNLLEGITRQSMEPLKSPTNETLSMSTRISNANESTVITEELKLMKNVIKLLEDTNEQLKLERIQDLTTNLPEFPRIKKPLEINDENQNLNENVKLISDLFKKSNSLIDEYYSSFVNIKVPIISDDLTTTNISKTNFHLQTTTQPKQISKKINDLKSKLNEIRTKLTPGTHIKTQLNTYETPEFTKAKNAIESNKSKLIAEISIPCNKPIGEVIDLHLSADEIKDIFKNFTILPMA